MLTKNFKMLFVVHVLLISLNLYSAEAEQEETRKIRAQLKAEQPPFHISDTLSEKIVRYFSKDTTELDKNIIIYGLEIPDHIKILTWFESSQLAEPADVDLVLELLRKKFIDNNGPDNPKNIESFLGNMQDLSEDARTKLEKLLEKKDGYKGDLAKLSYQQLVPAKFFVAAWAPVPVNRVRFDLREVPRVFLEHRNQPFPIIMRQDGLKVLIVLGVFSLITYFLYLKYFSTHLHSRIV